MRRNSVIEGDCLTILKTKWEDSIFDAVVTDPPYGLSFMGKAWDRGVPGQAFWSEFLRVSKPGAYLLAFGGTRTFHRLACAIEDAGWIIRDCLMWLYGTGFPKSYNFGKKEKAFEGYGTALKPAWEPIILAMKPCDGSFTENAQKWGVAGLNIDRCRVSVDPAIDDMVRPVKRKARNPETWMSKTGFKNEGHNRTGVLESGRWPANLVLSHLPGCTPIKRVKTKGVAGDNMKVQNRGEDSVVFQFSEAKHQFDYQGEEVEVWECEEGCPVRILNEQSDGASRFFYCSKASRKERGEGNTHPTVKPLALMRYLVRLVAPPGRPLILDPFLGSGSTALACCEEGFNFIGIDNDPEACAIAKKRLQEKDYPLFMRKFDGEL